MEHLLRAAVLAAGAIALAAPGAATQILDRPTDNDLKALVESVDDARDRFEDQLDGKVKNGIVRSAKGEVQVTSALDDFQRDLDNLKGRFSNDYAASAEAQTVLRRANLLQEIMAAQPAGIKGASEWDKLRGELRKLAAAYAAEFPLPEGAVARRINDQEAAGAVAMLIEQAELFKDAVGADKVLAKADKDAIKAQTADFTKQAKLLQSRLKDHKPATAEMRVFGEKFAALAPEGRQLPAAALRAIGAMRAPMDKLNQAFGSVSKTTTF
jgi:hypothetical protein